MGRMQWKAQNAIVDSMLPGWELQSVPGPLHVCIVADVLGAQFVCRLYSVGVQSAGLNNHRVWQDVTSLQPARQLTVGLVQGAPSVDQAWQNMSAVCSVLVLPVLSGSEEVVVLCMLQM